MLFVCTDAFGKRSLKISATPSDAKISIDGNSVGDGLVEYPITSKDNFIVIKIEKEGYLTVETKFYTSDKRNAVSYTLRPYLFYEASTPNGNANKFFSVEVLTSTMRHPFHIRVYANPDFLIFSSGLGCSGCRKVA